MDTIIGLGQAGCSIADKFSEHKQYKIYKIDVGLKGLKKNGIYDMHWQDGPERYESQCPNLANFFKNCPGEVLFVLGGGGDISGAALAVLEHLRGLKINVMYIRPDVNLLPERKKKQEWAVFNILQEYARSAVFKRLWLVDNTNVEKIIGNVPLIGYYDKLNELIVSTFHMLNVYNHIDSVTDTFSDPYKTHRISTLGISEMESLHHKLFFPLYKTLDLRYYYAINKNRLEEDGELFSNIKNQVKASLTEETKTSYGVFSTDYENDYVYVVPSTPFIQRQKTNDSIPEESS